MICFQIQTNFLAVLTAYLFQANRNSSMQTCGPPLSTRQINAFKDNFPFATTRNANSTTFTLSSVPRLFLVFLLPMPKTLSEPALPLERRGGGLITTPKSWWSVTRRMGGGCPKRCSFSLFLLLLLLFGTNPCLPIGRQKRRRRRRRRREERGKKKAPVGDFPSVPVWKSKCVVVLFENVFSVDGGRRVRPGFGRRRRRAAPPRGHAAAATTTLQPSAFRVSEHEHLQYSLSLSRQELDNLFQRKKLPLQLYKNRIPCYTIYVTNIEWAKECQKTSTIFFFDR